MTNPQNIVLTAVATTAVAGSGLAAALLLFRAHVSHMTVRAACLAGIIVVVFVAPSSVYFLLDRLNTTTGLGRIYIHLGRPGILLACSPVPKPKKLFRPVDEKEMDFLRPNEVRQLLDAFGDDHEMRAFFATAILTGMRVGEQTALMWTAIDFDRRIIKVRQAFSRKQFLTPKSKKSRRDISIDRNLVLLLREHQLRCGSRSEFVFSTSTGSPLDAANLLKRELRPALKRAGLRPIRTHDLRHTFASIMLNTAHCNLKFLQSQLGHSSITVTIDRYGHLMPEKHNDTVDLVGEMVLGERTA